MSPRFLKAAVLSLFLSLPSLSLPALAQSTGQYQTGTSMEATADPPVSRPHTKPCVVTLFDNQEFADFSLKPFTYTPPSDCRGPWAKVVFTGDFYITAGVQYDRTAEIYLDNVNIFYGTTPEPLAGSRNPWHVERDLTDYSSLFQTPQTGESNIGNIIETGLNGIIYGTAKLEFYPPDFASPAPRTPDQIVPLPSSGGSAYQITTAQPQLAQSISLPRNVERAYLDIIAESQNQEEQWFSCVPSTIATELGDCSNTAFREVEVSIDGKLAGVAPVYPWIYTGGIDPFLWVPIPGVQTLNFIPYRVDLTPFAGLLSNGSQHTVGIGVFNAYSYFNVAASLLVFEDHGTRQITGQVTEDSLTAPEPKVVNTVATGKNGAIAGTVTTTSGHNFEIEGYIDTSHGRVQTSVEQDVDFNNVEQISSTATSYVQNTTQTSTVHSKTITRDRFLTRETRNDFSYPITVNQAQTVNKDGSITQVTSIDQQYIYDTKDLLNGFEQYASHTRNEVTPADTVTFVPVSGGYQVGGNSNQSSTQKYTFHDSSGRCYKRTLTASANKLDSVKDGCQDRDDRDDDH